MSLLSAKRRLDKLESQTATAAVLRLPWPSSNLAEEGERSADDPPELPPLAKGERPVIIYEWPEQVPAKQRCGSQRTEPPQGEPPAGPDR